MAILFLLALLVGFFDDVLGGGWAKPVAMAATALGVPIFLRRGRKFWNQGAFWITVLAVAIIQIPLVIAVRPVIQRSGSIYLLAFGVADMLFVIAAILLVCSRSCEGGN